MTATKWEISIFKGGARDNRPHQVRATWATLEKTFTSFPDRSDADKVSLRAWSPTVYPPGATRSRDNVRGVTMLVLDIDDLPQGKGLRDVGKAWADWPHILHSSWSHSPTTPKGRLIVPLEAPIRLAPANSDPWLRCWYWAKGRMDAAGLPIDEACKDPSRLYFMPALRPGGHREAYVHHANAGANLLHLDPARLPASPEEQTRAQLQREAAERRKRMARSAPPGRRQRNDLLKVDPILRRELADRMGARFRGPPGDETAYGMPCPRCGRKGVWFPLLPRKTPQAMCEHMNSCGWMGWLDKLERGEE